MAITTMEEKFLYDLGTIYDAEHRFLDAQKELAQTAHSSELKQMIYGHISQTQQHIANLEQVFKLLDQKAKRGKGDAASGLVAEGQRALKELSGTPEVVDCAILDAVVKVEHYEIATYTALIAHAEQIAQASITNLFKDNLKQEEATVKAAEKFAPKQIERALQVRQLSA